MGLATCTLANFYLAPSRAWELFAGSICAFVMLDKPLTSRNVPSLAGLGMILFAIFYFDGMTPFPSLYALVPVVGTTLIILFAGQESWVGRFLGNLVCVRIGLIS